MTLESAKELQEDDEVYWTDPDEGKCSRYIQIKNVTIDEGNEIVSLYGKEGDYLQCLAHELVLSW